MSLLFQFLELLELLLDIVAWLEGLGLAPLPDLKGGVLLLAWVFLLSNQCKERDGSEFQILSGFLISEGFLPEFRSLLVGVTVLFVRL